MIPKTIHYCWFSGEEMSPFIRQCMATWKKHLPDYKWRLWDANSFDFSAVPFTAEAYKVKKWAFAADYVRLYALYTEGGIYMDTDVKVMKSFDEFLKYDFFTSHEYHPYIYEQCSKHDVSPEGYPKSKDVMI
ncbi:MAG: mannosyltransferase, partial [Bacteroidales bacterium]|nr:mannosyltransferase [Bacteroidales bacterium]